MLNIKIINGNPTTGRLEFEFNGKPGNGNGDAKQNWQVHWMVKPDTPVLSIVDIQMKTGNGAPPGTDIFTENPPSPQNDDGKHWKAKVDDFAPINSDYYYDIMWESESGVKTHDPKISVKPSD